MLECKNLVPDYRQKLLHQVIAHDHSKPSLINFLMLEAWKAGTVNCSQVQLQTILSDKRVTKFEVLERFLNFGTRVLEDDLSCAVRVLPNNAIDSLKLMASKCSKFDRNKLCQEASTYNKMDFVLLFVALGATLLGDCTGLLKQALQISDFDNAAVFTKSILTEAIQELDLGVLLKTTNLVASSKMIQLLMEKGISYSSKNSPMVAVMGLPLSLQEKVEAIGILIENGVDCKQLCQTTAKTTTPLHIATELALKLGKKLHFFTLRLHTFIH